MRVLYPAVVALAAFATQRTAATLMVKQASSSVSCWRTALVDSTLYVEGGPLNDAACAVSVEITDFSGTFAPGDNVPVVWSVSLNADPKQTNELKMPLPLELAQQITSTYVRTCETKEQCNPTTTSALATKPQSSNFSSNGDPVVFRELSGVSFDAPGEYTIAAFVDIGPVFNIMRFHYAAYATVTVSENAVPTTKQDQGVVRCRTSRQSALNATLDASANANAGDVCEVRIAVDPIAVVKPNAAVDVSWTATLDQSVDTNVRMPTPLIQTEVDGKPYEIVSAKLKLCKSEASCDEYTAETDLEAVVSAGPGSFAANVASFTAKQLVLPTAGPHLAMIQLVIGGQSRRYDFMYYMTLVASDSDIAAEVDKTTATLDAATTQCWSTLADGAATAVTSANVVAAGQGTNCPYTASLSVASVSIADTDTLDLSWTVAANQAPSSLKTGNVTASYDAVSKSYVTLPGLYLYACSEGTVCTPFSVNKTLLFTAPARNLNNDKTIINAEDVKFPSAGKFTLLAHSVVPVGAGRVDVAVYASVTVTPSASGGDSNTVTYVLISVGSVVGVVIIFVVVVWIRKRRHRKRMEKMVQYGLFGAPGGRGREGTMLKATESRTSGPSERVNSFTFANAERSPVDYPAYVSERKDSLSIDPYMRTSFMDMSVNESSVNESNLSFAFTDNFSVEDATLSFTFAERGRTSSDSEAYDV